MKKTGDLFSLIPTTDYAKRRDILQLVADEYTWEALVKDFHFNGLGKEAYMAAFRHFVNHGIALHAGNDGGVGRKPFTEEKLTLRATPDPP